MKIRLISGSLFATLFAAQLACASRIERGNLIIDNVPAPDPALMENLERYSSVREATPLSWSPAGGLLIATRFGDTEQLHLVEQPNGDRRQLTFFREAVDEAVFSKDAAHPGFVFLKNAGGDEGTQMYYQALGEPRARLLTDGKSMNSDPVWSSAGREIAFGSTLRNGRDSDIYLVDPAAGTAPRLVFTAESPGWSVLDWSPDDRHLLLRKFVSVLESHLYVFDIASAQTREIDASKASAGIPCAKFSRDGIGVYFATDRDSEFAQLRFLNLGSGEQTLLSRHEPWDIEELAASSDAHYVAYIANEGGASRLNVLDVQAKQELAVPALGSGLITHLTFDSASQRLAFGFESPSSPRDAYVLDLKSLKIERWTRSEAGPVDASRFVTPRLAQFPAFDRSAGRVRQGPVYLYEPVQAPGTNSPRPVLIQLHDGPQEQFRPGFDAWIQYVVNELGFAVIAPNLRGSSGYGRSYLSLDDGQLRDDVVKDLGALLIWISAQPSFDAKRVIVAGAGYGGYLTLAALVNFGDRLRGAVDLGGIANFVSFLSDTAPYRQESRRAEFGNEREPEMRAYLRRVSPLTNAERIARPVLVIQGSKNAGVAASESDQLVNRLRARGGEVWYLVAKDEGQEFKKRQNRDAALQAFAQFLAQMK